MGVVVSARPDHLFKQLSERAGREVVEVSYSSSVGGSVTLDGVPIAGTSNRIRGWAGIVVLLEAIPNEGMEFVKWEGLDEDAPLLLVELDKIERVKPVFKKRRAQPIRP
jgi:hypothetical protein